MPAPHIPDTSSQFRGEKGKDDLNAWISQAKMWFARTSITCKGNMNVTDAEVVHMFCLQAFKEGLPAQHWYEAN